MRSGYPRSAFVQFSSSFKPLGTYPNIDNAYGTDTLVTLPTGRQLHVTDIDLNTVTQRFMYANIDVTDYLSPDQKRLWEDFDLEAENNRLYIQHMNGIGKPINPGGSTSVLDLFTTNVAGTIDSIGSAIPGVTSSLAKIAIGGAVIYALFKLIPGKTKSPTKSANKS